MPGFGPSTLAPDDPELASATDLFHLLGNQVRTRMLVRLKAGSLETPQLRDLCDTFAIGKNRLSYQVRKLKGFGLISTESVGDSLLLELTAKGRSMLEIIDRTLTA